MALDRPAAVHLGRALAGRSRVVVRCAVAVVSLLTQHRVHARATFATLSMNTALDGAPTHIARGRVRPARPAGALAAASAPARHHRM